MREETLYYRRKNVIKTPTTVLHFTSIALAKKESRRIQLANGGLGCGVLKNENS